MVFQVSCNGAIHIHVETIHLVHLVKAVDPDDPVCHDFSHGVLNADGHVIAAPVKHREREAVLHIVNRQV